MTKKEYPKTVMLRKSILGLVLLGGCLLVILLLYNIFHVASQTKIIPKEKISKPTHETTWYLNQQVLQQTPKNNAETSAAPGSAETAIETTKAQEKQIAQDYEKAKKASISSNQIIFSAEKNQTSESLPSESSAPDKKHYADEFMPPEPEQNGQEEKKVFVKDNAIVDNDYLAENQKNPLSPYELKAGTIIPGILITGINSDLPGQIVGQVRANVYDTVSGNYVLIPQGAKVVGLYDSQIAYGQERVLIVWKRIIMPNGKSINLEGMPGVDLSGYTGFGDQVNNHYGKIFGSVLLLSVIGAGAQLSQPEESDTDQLSVNEILAASLGTNLANTADALTRKNINIQPTLEIRPGFLFNISVTKDMLFSGPYGK